MGIASKFNLVLIVVFAIGLTAASALSYRLLQETALSQVTQEARIMMQTAKAVRGYTTNEIKPLLDGQMQANFLPQTVPAYAATQNFHTLQKEYPDYSYKEASLNPTNVKNEAEEWEADLIRRFQADAELDELTGVRSTAAGNWMYLSHPIRIKDQTCLSCHTTPAMAPASMVEKYGTDNGYGWKMGEVVAAQVVAVPMSRPVNMANRAFTALLASLIGVFSVTLLVLNVMLRKIVIQPVTRLSSMADEVSKGNTEIEELPVHGKDEVAVLSNSFNRMNRSIQQAMKMLDES